MAVSANVFVDGAGNVELCPLIFQVHSKMKDAESIFLKLCFLKLSRVARRDIVQYAGWPAVETKAPCAYCSYPRVPLSQTFARDGPSCQ